MALQGSYRACLGVVSMIRLVRRLNSVPKRYSSHLGVISVFVANSASSTLIGQPQAVAEALRLT